MKNYRVVRCKDGYYWPQHRWCLLFWLPCYANYDASDDWLPSLSLDRAYEKIEKYKNLKIKKAKLKAEQKIFYIENLIIENNKII